MEKWKHVPNHQSLISHGSCQLFHSVSFIPSFLSAEKEPPLHRPHGAIRWLGWRGLQPVVFHEIHGCLPSNSKVNLSFWRLILKHLDMLNEIGVWYGLICFDTGLRTHILICGFLQWFDEWNWCFSNATEPLPGPRRAASRRVQNVHGPSAVTEAAIVRLLATWIPSPSIPRLTYSLRITQF